MSAHVMPTISEFVAALEEFANYRSAAVADGRLSSALAAHEIYIFAMGMSRTIKTFKIYDPQIRQDFYFARDRLINSIDPNFQANLHARAGARPAALKYEVAD